MEMEFALHPDDSARLPRSKLFGLPRPAWSRPRLVRLAWHDTPDRDLRADGLALEERRGAWRLERLTPGDGAWLPAQSAPVIAEARLLPDLAYPLPESLAPIAVFEGRLGTAIVNTTAGPVTLRLLRGTVGEIPVSRLTLDGPDAAVRHLALTLAEAISLTVPRASLAAEAIAIMEGKPPRARCLGAPRPTEEPSVTAAFAHVLGHLTDVIVYYAPLAAEGGPDTEPVHQMRVAVRRARSAIAVFRHGLACPDFAAADRNLKALGAVLGPTRDWDVFVTETLPKVAAALPDDAGLRRLTKAAQDQRETCHAALRTWLAAPAFRQLGIALAWLSTSQSWHDTLGPDERTACAMPPADFAAIVLQRRWKKVLSAGKDIAALDVPALHDLRLRAKRARYAMEIFQSAAHAKPAQRLIRRLSKLQEQLGILNDGAVADDLLMQLGGARSRHGYAVGLVLGFLAASSADMRPRVRRAWEKFHRTPRFWG